jgi:sporulation integral membrane protein YtvI
MQNQLWETYKRYRKPAFDVVLIVLTIFLVMKLFSYIYFLAFPVLLAFPIAALIRPLASFLHKRGMKKTWATNTSTFIFILIILGILTGIIAIFATQISHLITEFPKYVDFFKAQFVEKAPFFEKKWNALPPEITQKIQSSATTVLQKASSIFSNFFTHIVSTITSVSTMIANFVMAFVLAYFLCVDFDSISQSVKQKTPKTLKQVFHFLRENVLTGIGTYVIAQLKLISITFFIVLVGLLVIGADNAFSLALLSAVFDILPLLGVPAIFLPWIIYSLVVGKTAFAIKLAVILVITMVTRQLAEPKIAGDALGVSPFLMLTAMVVFLKLFGVAGMLLTPILLILIKQLYDKGIFQKWIRKPEGEYDHQNGNNP